MTNMEYRAYFLGNMYLSPIQQGIQAAHVVAEMFINHGEPNSTECAILNKWAEDHKTMILLNGGYASNIAEAFEKFKTYSEILGLPYAKFHEEKDSLNGALTSAGIIVPSMIYDYPLYTIDASYYSTDEMTEKEKQAYFTVSEIESDSVFDAIQEMATLLRGFRLA